MANKTSPSGQRAVKDWIAFHESRLFDGSMISSRRRAQRKRIILIGGGVFLLVFAMVAFTLVLRNWRGTVDVQPREQAEEGLERDDEFLGSTIDESQYSREELLQRILLRYFDTLSGGQGLHNLKSLRIQAHYAQSASEFPVQIIRKAPDMVRLTMHQNNMDIHMGYDGERIWRAFYAGGGLRKVERQGEDDLSMDWLRNSEFHDPLFLGYQKGWEMSYEGITDREGESVYEVNLKAPDSRSFAFFIDRNRFLPLSMEITETSSGDVRKTLIINREFKSYDGFVFPTRIRLIVDNEADQRFTYQDVEVNPGILDRAFEAPQTLEN